MRIIILTAILTISISINAIDLSNEIRKGEYFNIVDLRDEVAVYRVFIISDVTENTFEIYSKNYILENNGDISNQSYGFTLKFEVNDNLYSKTIDYKQEETTIDFDIDKIVVDFQTWVFQFLRAKDYTEPNSTFEVKHTNKPYNMNYILTLPAFGFYNAIDQNLQRPIMYLDRTGHLDLTELKDLQYVTPSWLLKLNDGYSTMIELTDIQEVELNIGSIQIDNRWKSNIMDSNITSTLEINNKWIATVKSELLSTEATNNNSELIFLAKKSLDDTISLHAPSYFVIKTDDGGYQYKVNVIENNGDIITYMRRFYSTPEGVIMLSMNCLQSTFQQNINYYQKVFLSFRY